MSLTHVVVTCLHFIFSAIFFAIVHLRSRLESWGYRGLVRCVKPFLLNCVGFCVNCALVPLTKNFTHPLGHWTLISSVLFIALTCFFFTVSHWLFLTVFTYALVNLVVYRLSLFRSLSSLTLIIFFHFFLFTGGGVILQCVQVLKDDLIRRVWAKGI